MNKPPLAAEIDRLRKENEVLAGWRKRYLQAHATISHAIEQELGEALGYPKYCDDKQAFPEVLEADGVCVGEHVPESLVVEAADRITKQAAEIDRLRAENAELRALLRDVYRSPNYIHEDRSVEVIVRASDWEKIRAALQTGEGEG